jgi:hypothetical protein
MWAAAFTTLSAPAAAFFMVGPGSRIDEVPVDRLLENLERNAQKLPPPQLWRAIGRVHLIAYIRQTDTLPVYRKNPETVAEGGIEDCAKVDAQADEELRKGWPKAGPGERCEVRDHSLMPSREIPANALGQSRTQSPHLEGARIAYSRAKSLEPSNLRTRLALAFVFDRVLRISEAREELRFLLNEGLRRFPYKTRREHELWGPEAHVVLGEAIYHFSLIAESISDKQLIARAMAALDANPPARMVTPILVPLNANLVFDNLIDRASKVAFDFTGQGPTQRFGWLTKDAAWLVWDPKNKGEIESGFQLFGSVTWLAFWDNGYHALGSLDDDGDGRIAGDELKGLALWQDKNADGKSDAGEVAPVADHRIVALAYGHTRVSHELWASPSGVTFADGETRPTYDWLLRAPDVLARD